MYTQYNVYKLLTPTCTLIGNFQQQHRPNDNGRDNSCQLHRVNSLVVDVQLHHGNTTWQQYRQCQQKRLRGNNLQ